MIFVQDIPEKSSSPGTGCPQQTHNNACNECCAKAGKTSNVLISKYRVRNTIIDHTAAI